MIGMHGHDPLQYKNMYVYQNCVQANGKTWVVGFLLILFLLPGRSEIFRQLNDEFSTSLLIVKSVSILYFIQLFLLQVVCSVVLISSPGFSVEYHMKGFISTLFEVILTQYFMFRSSICQAARKIQNETDHFLESFLFY